MSEMTWRDGDGDEGRLRLVEPDDSDARAYAIAVLGVREDGDEEWMEVYVDPTTAADITEWLAWAEGERS